MWLFLKDSFLSIVDPQGSYDGSTGPKGKDLLVRARFKGDIERVFPDAKVEETPNRDYRFRALINRNRVADTIADQVFSIAASNFKGSTKEKWRHDAYMGCWSVMEREQRRRSAGPREPGRKLFDELRDPPNYDPDNHADRFFSNKPRRGR